MIMIMQNDAFSKQPDSFNGLPIAVGMLELEPLCLDVKMYGPPQAHGAD